MNPKANFDKSIQKAEHFLMLYGLLKNGRKRAPRSTWAARFKTFMRWNSSTRIMKIEGASSLLIIKDPPEGLTYERFEHDYVSELLRAAVVAAVSAMDKYMHDHAVDKCYKLLSGPEKDIPKKLLSFELPALETFKAMKKIKSDPAARPGSKIKQALQAKLHKSTFQGAGDIDSCMALMNVKNFWREIADNLGRNGQAESIKSEINAIVRRRNYIVHEADIERRISSSKITFRKITHAETEKSLVAIKSFVDATESVLSA